MSHTRRATPIDRTIPTDDWIRGIVGPGALTASASTFSRRDVIRACCSVLPHGAEATTVEALADAVLGSDLVQLAPARAHEQRWTTPEVVAAERRLVEQARGRARAGVGVAAPAAIETVLSDRPQLPPVQSAAVRQVLASGAGVLVGVAARFRHVVIVSTPANGL